MPKVLRLYFTVIISIGILIIYFLLFINKYNFMMKTILFIVAIVICDFYEYYNDNKFSFSLNAANTVFLIIFFGPSIAMIALLIAITISSINRQRKKVVKSKAFIKYLFNISQISICIFITSSFVQFLKVDPHNKTGLYKIILTIVLYNALNLIFITCALSFPSRKFCFTKITQKGFLFMFYLLLSSVCLIFQYADRGIIGAILMYLMFLPIQKISQLYVQIQDQKTELITDTLTKTYNYKYLEQVLHNKVRKKELFSLIFIDIDEFKKINDTYGHTAGNYLLQRFVDMIKPKMERQAILCRYGGDEFCIITSNRQSAEKTAHNILASNNEYFVKYYEDNIRIPLSIGIYNHLSVGKSALDIIEEADMAMYKAKKMGGNRIVRCN